MGRRWLGVVGLALWGVQAAAQVPLHKAAGVHCAGGVLPPSEASPASPDAWASSHVAEAVAFYRKRIPSRGDPLEVVPVRLAIIDMNPARHVALPAQACQLPHTCVVAGLPQRPDAGSAEALAAYAVLSALDGASKGFEVMVSPPPADMTAALAASVSAVQGGARVLDWRWGVPMRCDTAAQAPLQAFFQWLQAQHPQVMVVSRAGELPTALISEQLLVVTPGAAGSDLRVDLSAATPVVSAALAAILSINPALKPAELRSLLHRSSVPEGGTQTVVVGEGEALPAPAAQLDVHRALELAVQSRERRR